MPVGFAKIGDSLSGEFIGLVSAIETQQAAAHLLRHFSGLKIHGMAAENVAAAVEEEQRLAVVSLGSVNLRDIEFLTRDRNFLATMPDKGGASLFMQGNRFTETPQGSKGNGFIATRTRNMQINAVAL